MVQGRFRWLLVLAAAIAAVVLFLVLRPGGGSESSSSSPRTIEITVENAKPVGGVVTATVDQGQKVELVVHSDVSDEVHLHGYDLHRDVEAGGTATIAFTANIAGRFEAELEERKERILSLTVEP